MSYAIFQKMDPREIYALPQHINQHGELVIATRNFAQLMGMTRKEVEVTRVRLMYGLFIDHNDTRLFVPKTILLKEALLIAEEMG
jgi:hypothetical protein